MREAEISAARLASTHEERADRRARGTGVPGEELSHGRIISSNDASDFSYLALFTAGELTPIEFFSRSNIRRCSLRRRLVSRTTLWYSDCCYSEDEVFDSNVHQES
jgi:hypothetical protein